jgi:hypothetical protein
MVAALAGLFVALAVLGLGFYVVRIMRPGSFRLRTSVLRVFTFSMEMESSGAGGKPSGKAAPALGPSGGEGEASGPAKLEALSGE